MCNIITCILVERRQELQKNVTIILPVTDLYIMIISTLIKVPSSLCFNSKHRSSNPH